MWTRETKYVYMHYLYYSRANSSPCPLRRCISSSLERRARRCSLLRLCAPAALAVARDPALWPWLGWSFRRLLRSPWLLALLLRLVLAGDWDAGDAPPLVEPAFAARRLLLLLLLLLLPPPPVVLRRLLLVPPSAPPPPCTPTKLSAGLSGLEACRTVAERDGGIVAGTPRSAPLLLPIDACIDADVALHVRVPLSGAAEMEKASTTPREEDRNSAAATPREEHAMVLFCWVGASWLGGADSDGRQSQEQLESEEGDLRCADLQIFDGAGRLTR